MNRDEPRWTEMNRDSNLDSSRFISVHLGSSSVHLDWFRHMSVRKHESGTFLYENTISAHFGTKTQNVHIYTNPREHVYRCPPQFVLIVWSILINHIYIYIYIYVMLNSEFLSNIFQECYLGAIYSHIYIYLFPIAYCFCSLFFAQVCWCVVSHINIAEGSQVCCNDACTTAMSQSCGFPHQHRRGID